jgi:hypothetical protein
MVLKIHSQKMAKKMEKMAFLTPKNYKISKHFIITLVYKKNNNFSPNIAKKLPKG